MKIQVFTTNSKEQRDSLKNYLDSSEIIKQYRIRLKTEDLEVEGCPTSHYMIKVSTSGYFTVLAEGLKCIKEHNEINDMYAVGVLQDIVRNANEINANCSEGEIPNPYTLKTKNEIEYSLSHTENC